MNELFNLFNSQQSSSFKNSNCGNRNNHNTYNYKSHNINFMDYREKQIDDDNYNIIDKNTYLDKFINNYKTKNFKEKEKNNEIICFDGINNENKINLEYYKKHYDRANKKYVNKTNIDISANRQKKLLLSLIQIN